MIELEGKKCGKCNLPRLNTMSSEYGGSRISKRISKSNIENEMVIIDENEENYSPNTITINKVNRFYP
jgi:hypothetical protein